MSEVTVETLAQSLQTHLTDCMEVRKDTNLAMEANTRALKSVQTEIAEFKKLPMRAVGWIAAIVLGSVASVLTQNFLLHQDAVKTAHATEIAATSAATGQAQIVHRLDQIQYPFSQ